MSFASALSEPLRSLRPVRVLERSLERGTLAHGILLHGDNLEDLSTVATAITSELLRAKPERALAHPDCFTLRPAKRGRQIRIAGDAGRVEPNTMRWLLREIQQTANQGGRKVAILFEADRMNDTTANAFLKTLEEPPEDTTLLLLTTRPHDLLPTIRSRCLGFRIPTGTRGPQDPLWTAWKQDYGKWMRSIAASPKGDRTYIATAVIGAYALSRQFFSNLEAFSSAQWERMKASLPAEIEDDESEALEAGLRKGLRQRLLADVEWTTRDHALGGGLPGPVVVRALPRVIALLEDLSGLLEVNLRDEVVLETFLLGSLRIWYTAIHSASPPSGAA